MATATDLHRIALSLAGTTEAPHFDRTAFKAARIYATLASDKRTANLKLSPEEQEFKCMLAPDAFSPVPNAWGKQGWTTVTLAKIKVAELKDVLETAWGHAVSSSRSKAKKTRLQRKGRA
jgi:YjbR